MSLSTNIFNSLKLNGHSLLIARLLWFSGAALAIVLFIAGIPNSFAISLRLSPTSQTALHVAGLPMSFPAYVLVGTDIFTLLIFSLIAFLLIWQRGDELITLVVAAMLLFTGALYTGPTANGNLPYALLATLPGLAETMQLWFIYLFPDGRPLRKWLWWALIPLPLWRIGIWWLDYIPTYKAETHTAENYSHTPQQAWDIGLFIVLLALGLALQVYRYRTQYTPAQRQQSKWVLFGAALAVAFVSSYVIIFNVLGFGENSSLLVSLAARLLRQLALMIVPITMAIAILRYRLWDIDFAINRSLVYGGLIILGVGLFAFILWISSNFIQGAAATLLVTLLLTFAILALVYRPSRYALQRLVDQQLYHININYTQPKRPTARNLTPQEFPRAHFNEYTDLQLAGQGGMAEVYKATHPTLQQTVAIKMMRAHLSAQPELKRYFDREANLLKSLTHPNIIKIFDVGEVNQHPYMVMEFINGNGLHDQLAHHPKLTPTQALQILQPLAAALDYLHTQNILHRDVKPSNIMLEDAYTPPRPVLTDFGLAKVIGEVSIESQSGVAGTFAYIAPEQISLDKTLDGRADLYAFGAMAFQLLTGELPFKHHNASALLIAHMMHPAPDACESDPSFPRAAANALQKAMAKQPAERFATVTEFVAELKQSFN